MRFSGFLAGAVVGFACLSPFFVFPQTEGRETKPLQLRLEIIPLKQIYAVGETVSLKYRLKSLADGTLCFPPPDPAEENAEVGYFQVKITPPKGTKEVGRFIDVVDSRRKTEDELRSDANDRWVKLGPFEPYQTPKAGEAMVPTASGDWILQSTYYPPRFKDQRKAMIKSLGCSPPDRPVRSRPIKITVEDPHGR